MEKVIGIGGLFFRAEDPERLSLWYEENLGVNLAPKTYDDTPWVQESGVTIFAPFEKTSDYFGDQTKQWMINFRVADLKKMVEQLRNAGIEVEVSAEVSPIGNFARLNDPEGNPIELWQPSTNT